MVRNLPATTALQHVGPGPHITRRLEWRFLDVIDSTLGMLTTNKVYRAVAAGHDA